jgi:hypothetical protein
MVERNRRFEPSAAELFRTWRYQHRASITKVRSGAHRMLAAEM